jgi:hypothetical protein
MMAACSRAPRFRGSVMAIALAVALPACATHRFEVPGGPGVPAPEAPAIWSKAIAGCRGASTYSAEIRLSGRVGAGRPFKATILGGFSAGGGIRLEMVAPFGAPAFVLAGSGPDATLLLPRDRRWLRAAPDAIVEALIGLRLGPRSLLALLSGCVDPSNELIGSERYGDTIAAMLPGGRAFLRQQGPMWRVVAADLGALGVEYRAVSGSLPTDVRLATPAGRTPAVALSLSIRQVEVNGVIDASTFSVAVPAGATPLTLDELRTSGPLGGNQ